MGSFPNQNFLTGKPANENLYVQTFLNEKIKKDSVFSEGIPLARRRNRTDVSQHATVSLWLQECWPDNATLQLSKKWFLAGVGPILDWPWPCVGTRTLNKCKTIPNF